MANERKEIITLKDLGEILGGVSYTTAGRKMREVKKVSNRLNIKGMIHKLDWDDYLNRFNKKEDSATSTKPNTVFPNQITTVAKYN